MQCMGNVQSVERSSLQFASESIDQLHGLFQYGLPFGGFPLPCACCNQSEQSGPVFRIAFARLQDECPPALQFGEFAENERTRILPDKFFRQSGLSKDIEMQSRGE